MAENNKVELSVVKTLPIFCKYIKISPVILPEDDAIITSLTHHGYIRLMSDNVTFIVVQTDHSIGTKTSEIRKILGGESGRVYFITSDKSFSKQQTITIIQEFMKENNQLIWIPHRVMVMEIPKHVCVGGELHICTDEEKEFLANGTVKHQISSLPILKVSDPLAIWYNCKVKDIVKLTEFSYSAGSRIVYKRVIK